MKTIGRFSVFFLVTLLLMNCRKKDNNTDTVSAKTNQLSSSTSTAVSNIASSAVVFGDNVVGAATTAMVGNNICSVGN